LYENLIVGQKYISLATPCSKNYFNECLWPLHDLLECEIGLDHATIFLTICMDTRNWIKPSFSPGLHSDYYLDQPFIPVWLLSKILTPKHANHLPSRSMTKTFMHWAWMVIAWFCGFIFLCLLWQGQCQVFSMHYKELRMGWLPLLMFNANYCVGLRSCNPGQMMPLILSYPDFHVGVISMKGQWNQW